LEEKDNLMKVVIEEKEKLKNEREKQLLKIQEEMNNFRYLKSLEYQQNEKEKEKLLEQIQKFKINQDYILNSLTKEINYFQNRFEKKK
jgi:hypothetical protein